MSRCSLVAALQVMLAVWTILLCGPLLSPRIGEEPATLLVFCLAAALLVRTRYPAPARPRLRQSALFALGIAVGFAGHSPLCGAIGLAGLAIGLDPGTAPPPGAGGPLLLVAVVAVAPVFEELLYRERILDAIAATPLGTAGAALVSSALFALPHLAPWQVLGSFVVGLVLALVRQLLGTVTACIGMHAGLNLRSVCDGAGGALHG
jgi:membrane protease YdiL (CAAX protease family)